MQCSEMIAETTNALEKSLETFFATMKESKTIVICPMHHPLLTSAYEKFIKPGALKNVKEKDQNGNGSADSSNCEYELVEGDFDPEFTSTRPASPASDCSDHSSLEEFSLEGTDDSNVSGEGALESSVQTALEESTNTALEDSTQTALEESTDTALEESTNTALEESTDTALEDSTQTALEESTHTALDDSTETALDESTETALEESTNTALEESTNTAQEDEVHEEAPAEDGDLCNNDAALNAENQNQVVGNLDVIGNEKIADEEKKTDPTVEANVTNKLEQIVGWRRRIESLSQMSMRDHVRMLDELIDEMNTAFSTGF